MEASFSLYLPPSRFEIASAAGLPVREKFDDGSELLPMTATPGKGDRSL